MTTVEETPAVIQEHARNTFRRRQAADQTLTGKTLGNMYGKSERWGRDRIAEVRAADGPGDLRIAEVLPFEGTRQPLAAVAADEAATAVLPKVERQPEAAAAAVEQAPAKLAVKRSTWVFLVGAVVGLGVSINTSWQYFDLKMGIHDVAERVTMFAGLEIVLLACGVSMFEAARDPKIKAGPARVLAWSLCAVSAFAALQLSGGLVGPMRVALGPVLALVALHRALGIEKHSNGTQGTGALAKVGREMRERMLSRLGLADDGRDAQAKTKVRSARRAARLSLATFVPFRTARVRRAMDRAEIETDAAMRDLMLAYLRTTKHAASLRDLPMASPWKVEVDTP